MSEQAMTPADEPNDVVASEKLLANALGGAKGLIDSSLPTVAFIVLFTIVKVELMSAVYVALGTATVLAVIRLVQKHSLQQVVSGLIGVAIAAWFVSRSGRAEDYFLPGLLTNLAYGIGILLSILIRFPAVGFVVGALTGDVLGWRKDPAKIRLYSLVSWWWVGMFSLRLLVQVPLYLVGSLELLATARLIMGWPLYLAVAFVTYRAIKAQAR
ncbi:MAG: DUF3159 domain-containing protein [Candidatus Nanopelagicales bacterium]